MCPAPHELTFNDMERELTLIRQEVTQEYELKLKQRMDDMKSDLTRKLREEIDGELRLEYIAMVKSQRETLRKEILSQV